MSFADKLRMRRRDFLGGLAGTSLAALLPTTRAFAQEYAGREIAMASWGGEWEQAQVDSFRKTFTERTGATVLAEAMEDSKLRTMVARGGVPDWDVADVASDLLFSGKKLDLFDAVDKQASGFDRIDPRFQDDYGVGFGVWSWNVSHNSDAFPDGTGPKTWADLFDFEKFPGTRGIGDRVNPMLEVALLADGVDPKDLYPLDVDRAFRKLDELKGKFIMWSSHAQCMQLMTSGETPLGLATNTRVFAARRDGAHVANTPNQNLLAIEYLTVVKNSANADLGWILIDEMTKPENQAFIAKRIALSPANTKAFEELTPEEGHSLPTYPANLEQAVILSDAFWEDNAVTLEERWTAWKLS